MMLIVGINVIGIMSFFFYERQQRAAFLETEKSLETKLILEQESQEQVSSSSSSSSLRRAACVLQRPSRQRSRPSPPPPPTPTHALAAPPQRMIDGDFIQRAAAIRIIKMSVCRRARARARERIATHQRAKTNACLSEHDEVLCGKRARRATSEINFSQLCMHCWRRSRRS